MYEKEIYNPFGNKKYNILKKDNKKYLEYNNIKYELNDNGYIPKSGLLFDNVLNEKICKNKRILDLGCGYMGILSLISNKYKALELDAVDYDIECIKWFNKIIDDNSLNHINCYKSNWFSNINKKYDVILTNPPQMPMRKKVLHDSGGINGRKYIIQILKKANKYLLENGCLYLLAFDFLGTNERTNKKKSLFEIANKYGFKDSKIVFEIVKKIKKDSVTYNNLDYINKVYPYYNFGNKNKKCKIQIICFRR